MCTLNGIMFVVQDPNSLADWYSRVLGMQCQSLPDGTQSCGYLNDNKMPLGCRLLFGGCQDEEDSEGSYTADRSSVYWKISLYLRDVALARERIMQGGVSASVASQFKDIGYLSHMADPRGFSIELLQETFEQNFERLDPVTDLALGQPGIVGLITLRCSDIKRSLQFYQTGFGMKLLSIQPVSEYGFCLYFLAFTDDEPPVPDDLESVENREWLWQRKYTAIELQHRPGAEITPLQTSGERVRGVDFSVNTDVFERLQAMESVSKINDMKIVLDDPDGMKIFVTLK